MTDPILVGTAVVFFGALIFVAVMALLGYWSRRPPR